MGDLAINTTNNRPQIRHLEDLPNLDTEKMEDNTVKSVAIGVTFLGVLRQEKWIDFRYALLNLDALF